jgi:hypothetical protein
MGQQADKDTGAVSAHLGELHQHSGSTAMNRSLAPTGDVVAIDAMSNLRSSRKYIIVGRRPQSFDRIS